MTPDSIIPQPTHHSNKEDGIQHTIYVCQGTCSKAIEVTTKDGIIENVTFYGGCNGNTKGISTLVRGMKVEDVIAKLKGTQCGNRGTSCPDQLAHALEQLSK
ncbi:MAG: TIGR03905 family TSCPD domain-containing protein [Bacteroidaceae bacterium]|nr:TIGR03905 family TSCPD domain-containing protein [Bacteroidaceae bacterium]